MKTIFYARKKRQLKGLIRKVKHEITLNDDGRKDFLNSLILKIRQLIRELQYVFSRKALLKLFSGVAIPAALFFSTDLSAQIQFAAPVENPFGLVTDSSYLDPALIDLDGDGDLDFVIGDIPGDLVFFENTGDANNPAFAAASVSPFGLAPLAIVPTPDFADLDDDGDMDILAGSYYGLFLWYENTGSAMSPQFDTAFVNSFGLGNTFFYSNPAFVDIDNDGDFDLFSGQYAGDIAYFENTGTASAPQFDTLMAGPFGLDTTYFNHSPDFADLDGDGDMDLLMGDYYGNLVYFENAGTATNPAFMDPVPNPFGLSATGYFANPTFADIDDDGDDDIFSIEINGKISYFENTTPGVGFPFIPKLDLNVFPNPSNSHFFIDSEELIEIVELQDALGRTVLTYEGTRNSYSVEQLESGTYMLKVQIAGKEYFGGNVVVSD